jgi:hypothetical protein
MFGSGITVRDNMASILSRILRLPVDGKPVTILDLSAVPSEILNVTVSVLCRLLFDFAVWSDGAIPILLVCEEAHRYAPEDDKAGFGPAKRALSRIAKEGRKYGLSLCVATQRPAELAAGMLSQCNTIFTMRLSTSAIRNWCAPPSRTPPSVSWKRCPPSAMPRPLPSARASPCPCAWSSPN